MPHFTANKMELNLIKVYDATLLSSSKVYQINGTLSRYLGDEGSIKHPQFVFLPLPNQKKKASFRLNRNKLMTRIRFTVLKHLQFAIFGYINQR
jgi:hypothetical protein